MVVCSLRTPQQVMILDECPVADHNQCRISYPRNRRYMEYCMCRCHPHAKPAKKEPDRIGVIGMTH